MKELERRNVELKLRSKELEQRVIELKRQSEERFKGLCPFCKRETRKSLPTVDSKDPSH